MTLHIKQHTENKWGNFYDVFKSIIKNSYAFI